VGRSRALRFGTFAIFYLFRGQLPRPLLLTSLLIAKFDYLPQNIVAEHAYQLRHNEGSLKILSLNGERRAVGAAVYCVFSPPLPGVRRFAPSSSTHCRIHVSHLRSTCPRLARERHPSSLLSRCLGERLSLAFAVTLSNRNVEPRTSPSLCWRCGHRSGQLQPPPPQRFRLRDLRVHPSQLPRRPRARLLCWRAHPRWCSNRGITIDCTLFDHIHRQ
jgi:hypothetical protein